MLRERRTQCAHTSVGAQSNTQNDCRPCSSTTRWPGELITCNKAYYQQLEMNKARVYLVDHRDVLAGEEPPHDHAASEWQRLKEELKDDREAKEENKGRSHTRQPKRDRERETTRGGEGVRATFFEGSSGRQPDRLAGS